MEDAMQGTTAHESARRRSATAGVMFAALAAGAVLAVAHRGTGDLRASATAADAGFFQLAGADDNDYPGEIDDSLHAGCPGFEDSAQFTSSSCTDTDDGFCHEVKNDWCNGTMCEIFNVSGCSTCDGMFGACVMDALNFLPSICNKTGHGRRLAHTSGDELARQRAAASAAVQRKSVQNKIVASNFTEYPDCDIYAYCKKCAHGTCNTIMEAAHAGNITGVDSLSDYDHGWHAGQAAKVLLSLDTVCDIYG